MCISVETITSRSNEGAFQFTLSPHLWEELFSPLFASSPFCFVASLISGGVYSWIIDTSPTFLGPILTSSRWIWAQHSHTAASANPGVQDCLMQSLLCPSPTLSMTRGKHVFGIWGWREEEDGSGEHPAITDPIAKTGAELTDSPPPCFTCTAFPVFSDRVFCTEIWGEKHIRFHISLEISLLPKQAAEYKWLP